MSRQQQHDFETQVRESTSSLTHVARSLLQQEEGVEDVLQESFGHAYQNWLAFVEHDRSRLCIRPWLHALAKEAACAYLSQQTQAMSLEELRTQGQVEIKAHPWECPEQVVAHKEAEQLIKHELDQLCLRERAAFIARFIEGKGYEDIAQTLKVNKRTAIVYAYRGRQLLRWKVQRHHLDTEGQLFWDQTCEVVTLSTMLALE